MVAATKRDACGREALIQFRSDLKIERPVPARVDSVSRLQY
jgi:hypothetical protein